MERKKYNIHYFEPEDTFENYPYEIDLETQEKFKKLEEYFTKFYYNELLEKAKKEAKEESENKKLQKENFIYGEVNFRAISYILLYLTHVHKLDEKGYFYDLGSGTGRAVIGAALSTYFSKYIGIEYLDSLYNTSIIIKNKFEKDFENYYKDNKDILPKYNNGNNMPDIEFIHGDFLKIDLSNASFIFINSTTFSDKLLGDLAQKFNEDCKSGTIVVNTTMELSKLDKNKWEFLPYFRRYMSWGIATINVYKRK